MTGRGRGRAKGNPVGRGGFTLSYALKAVGLTRNDLPPKPLIVSKQLYPDLERRAGPLPERDEDADLIAIDMRLEQRFQESPFYIAQPSSQAGEVSKRKHLERYGDKYEAGETSKNSSTDFSTSDPDELKLIKDEFNAWREKRLKPGLKRKQTLDEERIKSRLSNLEEKEESASQAKKSSSAPGGEAGDAIQIVEGEEEVLEDGAQEAYEVIIDEDELEEGMDYLIPYFDNGEDYLEHDEGADDGPLY